MIAEGPRHSLPFQMSSAPQKRPAPLRGYHHLQRSSQRWLARWRSGAVQGIGGLGHLGVQFARHMGFRTVAIGRGREKEKLAKD